MHSANFIAFVLYWLIIVDITFAISNLAHFEDQDGESHVGTTL